MGRDSDSTAYIDSLRSLLGNSKQKRSIVECSGSFSVSSGSWNSPSVETEVFESPESWDYLPSDTYTFLLMNYTFMHERLT